MLVNRKRSGFEGFSGGTIDFLKNLHVNNNKEWFHEHKADFEKYVMLPMRSLVEELSPTILAIDPYLDVAPRVDRTISRIHRDVRFAKDKSPYKTTLWIVFKHNRKDWKDTIGYFLEFSATRYRYGMGFYQATKRSMDNLRELLDRKPKEFLKAVEFMKSGLYELEGETYKRLLDHEKSGTILDWYQRRNCYVVRNKKLDHVFFSPELAEELSDSYRIMEPLYHFLWKAR